MRKTKAQEVFNPPSEWIMLWDEWITYKKVQHRFTFKAARYEEMSFNKLMELSGGDIEKAAEIILQSIENGYKGLFPLKDERKVTTTQQPTEPAITGYAKSFFSR